MAENAELTLFPRYGELVFRSQSCSDLWPRDHMEGMNSQAWHPSGVSEIREQSDVSRWPQTRRDGCDPRPTSLDVAASRKPMDGSKKSPGAQSRHMLGMSQVLN